MGQGHDLLICNIFVVDVGYIILKHLELFNLATSAFVNIVQHIYQAHRSDLILVSTSGFSGPSTSHLLLLSIDAT